MTVDEAGFRFAATPLPKARVVEATIDCDSFVRVAAEARQARSHGVNDPPPGIRYSGAPMISQSAWRSAIS
jgi:hypothetical protein